MTDFEAFEANVGEWSGPIDLLLQLIEKRKMHISDVSLADIADDYVAHVRELESLPVADTAHFIYIASILMLIKSKSLLPGLEVTEEEAEAMEDLEARLREHKLMKERAKRIESMFGRSVAFPALEGKQRVVVFAPSEEIKQESLLESLRNMIKSIPVVEKIPEAIVKKVISLEEVIDDLATRVQRGISMGFKEFSKSVSKGERANVVVSFLAMLELVKQGALDVAQKGQFEDIKMQSTDTSSTPNYS